MMTDEIARVSATVLGWLEDPFSVPKDQPHCWSCNTPKIERNTRCEVCGERSAITGPKPTHGNVFIEPFKPKRKIIVRKGWRN
jgi:hypothetical protein